MWIWTISDIKLITHYRYIKKIINNHHTDKEILLNKLNKIDMDCHCITTRCCHPCRNENFGRIEEERNYWMGIVFKEEKYRCASISKSQWEALEKGLNVPIFHDGIMFPPKTMIIKMSDYETPE